MNSHNKIPNPLGSHNLYRHTSEDLIGSGEKIQMVKSLIHKVSRRDSSVLIYGETGTGKDLTAQAIHMGSSRRSYPFVSRNCAAIPENLIESTFFGTRKGSFTGAEDRIGIFEAGNGGTVFLDEINSMSLDLQVKLLKVIEAKHVIRLGDTALRPLNIRILAAMNQDPLQCLRDEKIRPDLFYRLASIQIHLPPLRQRREDIPQLIEFFIQKFNRDMGLSIKGVSSEVMSILLQYHWPGNVRELRNVIEGAFTFSESSTITKDDLPFYIWQNTDKEISPAKISPEISCDLSLADFHQACEYHYLSTNMPRFSTRKDLADFAGISKQTLNYKLQKHQLFPSLK